MPTLSSETPDAFNLNYFYKKYSDILGVAFYKEDPNKIILILFKSKPISCLIKTLRSNSKITYFLFTSKTSTTTKYFCSAYYTNFISANNTKYNSSSSNFTTLATNSSNKKTKVFFKTL